MSFRYVGSLFACVLLVGTTGNAAASVFTWNPNAVKLNGSKVTADTLVLSDYAQITFQTDAATGVTTFQDRGILPIVGFTLNGAPVTAPGYLAPGGWGAYISYTAAGTQATTQTGLQATFSTLNFQIIGYNGTATFGFTADGRASEPFLPVGIATVEGALSNVTTLEQGSLVSNANNGLTLSFATGVIAGHVSTSLQEVKPQFVQANPSGLEVTFLHPAADYYFTSATNLQIVPGGAPNSTATLVDRSIRSNALAAVAAVDLPEPASWALLMIGLSGVAMRRGRARKRG